MQTQKPKKKYELCRNIAMTFRVTPEERDMIHKRMKETGIINRRHFILKMLLSGRIIRVELNSVRDMNRVLCNLSNNVNQIARRVNQTGNIYDTDIEDMKAILRKMWDQQNNVYGKLLDLMQM